MSDQKQLVPLNTLLKETQTLLKARAIRIIDSLPAHIKIEKVISAVLSEIVRNKDLQKCSPSSIYYATLQSARLGLIPNSLTAEAYLVPRNNSKTRETECNFQAGYLGLLNLAYQSPLIKVVDVCEVFDKDSITIMEGTERKLEHKRPPLTEKRGKVIAYYAIVELTTGAKRFEIMNIDEIHEHKQKYALGWERAGSAWQKSFAAMAKKTVLRRLLKFTPASTEHRQLQEAIALDEKTETGISTQNNIIEGELIEGESYMDENEQVEVTNTSKADQLANKLEKPNVKKLNWNKIIPHQFEDSKNIAELEFFYGQALDTLKREKLILTEKDINNAYEKRRAELEKKPEQSPFQDHLNKISLSESRTELQAAYDIAIDKAKDAKDNGAMTELKKAYEVKLTILSKGEKVFMDKIVNKYAGTRLGRQEIYAEILEDEDV